MSMPALVTVGLVLLFVVVGLVGGFFLVLLLGMFYDWLEDMGVDTDVDD